MGALETEFALRARSCQRYSDNWINHSSNRINKCPNNYVSHYNGERDTNSAQCREILGLGREG